MRAWYHADLGRKVVAYTARMGKRRYDVTFAGRVQGVGFRATTMSVAKEFEIAGWVRNEPDGSVRCVAEGDDVEIERFVKAVEDRMSGYVRDVRIQKSAATGELDGFTVRY